MKRDLLKSILFLFLLSGCDSNHSESKTDNDHIKTVTIVNNEDSSFNVELDRVSSLISRFPNNPDYYHERATVRLKFNKLEGSLQDLKAALILDTNNAQLYLTLAEIYVKMNLGKSAIESVDRALSVNPKYAPALIKKGEFLYYRKEYDRAFKAINDGLKIDVTNPKAYFWKGMIYKDQGNKAKAISSFQTAIEQDPDYVDAYLQLGLLFSGTDEKLAYNYLKNVLRIQPKNDKALYAMAYSSQTRGLLDSAKADYKRILVYLPNDNSVNYNLAYINMLQDSFGVAVSYLSKVIQVDSMNADAWFYRGLCYQKLGKTSSAETDINEAKSIKPGIILNLPKQEQKSK